MKSDTLRDLEALAYVSFSDEYQDVLVVTREVGDVRDNRGRYEVAKPRPVDDLMLRIEDGGLQTTNTVDVGSDRGQNRRSGGGWKRKRGEGQEH
ncbi:hypothetical protein VTN49DRAFT_3345 [Thermomyces lanuginosus]|uniref:uncharacterized protein n=1 Tax=Thermomyces lanuginosus TaxID=5541 RepID=UPI003743C5BD